MKKRDNSSHVVFQNFLIWFHGIVAGVYLSDTNAESFGAYIWNFWWIFIWSLCLLAVYYIFKEKFTLGATISGGSATMPAPDLDKYKKDDKAD